MAIAFPLAWYVWVLTLEMAFVLPHKTPERSIPSAEVSPASERGEILSDFPIQLFLAFSTSLFFIYRVRPVGMHDV